MAKLILLRHGESVWNRADRFTGWTDVDLSEKGRAEAREAAALLATYGLRPDWCCSSYLKRAIRTLWIVLDEMDAMWLPVEKHWRLNERHYGALQGLNKAETAERVGAEQVYTWRRSYAVRPPALEVSDERFPGRDPRYAALRTEDLPLTESLADVVTRLQPFWNDGIAPQIEAGRTVLVVAHGNSLRAMVKYLDDVSDKEISNLEIATGAPICYELDHRLQVKEKECLQCQRASF